MNYLTKIKTDIGELTVTCDEISITGLWIKNQKYYPQINENIYKEENTDIFNSLKKWLDIYFSGSEPDFKIPVNPTGSEFRKQVWDILLEIPFGKYITYRDIAKRIKAETGKNASAQAVGGAVGHNPVSILIPCHRVIGADGNLTGYAGGIETKMKLLMLEKADTSKLFIK